MVQILAADGKNFQQINQVAENQALRQINAATSQGLQLPHQEPADARENKIVREIRDPNKIEAVPTTSRARANDEEEKEEGEGELHIDADTLVHHRLKPGDDEHLNSIDLDAYEIECILSVLGSQADKEKGHTLLRRMNNQGDFKMGALNQLYYKKKKLGNISLLIYSLFPSKTKNTVETMAPLLREALDRAGIIIPGKRRAYPPKSDKSGGVVKKHKSVAKKPLTDDQLKNRAEKMKSNRETKDVIEASSLDSDILKDLPKK
jgi:hypothetical protein